MPVCCVMKNKRSFVDYAHRTEDQTNAYLFINIESNAHTNASRRTTTCIVMLHLTSVSVCDAVLVLVLGKSIGVLAVSESPGIGLSLVLDSVLYQCLCI